MGGFHAGAPVGAGGAGGDVVQVISVEGCDSDFGDFRGVAFVVFEVHADEDWVAGEGVWDEIFWVDR